MLPKIFSGEPRALAIAAGISVALALTAAAVLPHWRSPRPVGADSEFALAAAQPQRWIVSAREARMLLLQGATLLDARPDSSEPPLPSASVGRWQDFSRSEPGQRGELLADDAVLAQKLQQLGVSRDRPVVVVGDPQRGWGEDGRLVWMLRTLGHPQAVLVDGGATALAATDLPADLPAPETGDFTVQRRDRWAIARTQVKANLDRADVVLLDTREAREYSGATPYGEARGGHLPGAQHLYYKDLLEADGRLRSRDEIAAQLAARGITAETEIIAYCTGGVRSAWLTAVLADLGYSVQNYAGSTWQWSAAPAATYPLE